MRSVRLTLIFAAALAVGLLLPALASADGITWTLNDVNLDDGGTVTGSFNFDANANTYSAINLTSTLGSLLDGTSYATLTPAFISGSTVLGVGPAAIPGDGYAGLTFLEIMFLDPLTNDGGTEPIQVFEIFCASSDCSAQTERLSIDGTVVGSPISAAEPSAFFLLAGGLLALALFRRRLLDQIRILAA